MNGELESRVLALETQIGNDLRELVAGLKSTGKEPGLYENVRQMSLSILTLTTQVSLLTVKVEKLEQTKQQLHGAYLACGVIGGVVGFLASYLK